MLPASFKVGITRANFSGCELDVITEWNLCSSSLDDLGHASVGSRKHLFLLDLACVREFPGEVNCGGGRGLDQSCPKAKKITPMPWNCNPVADLEGGRTSAVSV